MKFFFIAIASLLAAALPILADDKSASPPFTKLQDALAFIDAALDKEDWDLLKKDLYPPYQEPRDPNRDYWAQLKEERGKSRLVDDFPNQTFPTNGTTLEIGASPIVGAKLNGWSRIKFIKANDGWHLNAVYGVR